MSGSGQSLGRGLLHDVKCWSLAICRMIGQQGCLAGCVLIVAVRAHFHLHLRNAAFLQGGKAAWSLLIADVDVSIIG